MRIHFILPEFLHKLSIEWLFHLGYMYLKSRCIRSVHNNFLKLYMDEEKATIDNMTAWFCKSFQGKLKIFNEMEPDRTFGLG